jgi:hypothetical protein
LSPEAAIQSITRVAAVDCAKSSFAVALAPGAGFLDFAAGGRGCFAVGAACGVATARAASASRESIIVKGANYETGAAPTIGATHDIAI